MKRLISAAVVAALGITAAFAVESEGLYLKPGSGTGKIAFIDTQSRLSEKSIREAMKRLDKSGEYNMVYEKARPAECPSELKAASKADFALIVIDDAKKPVSLVAPDDGWAMVNVATLDRGLKTESAKAKFFEGRCRRQILRIFALGAGGGASMYPNNLSHPCKLEKLDLFKEELPFDVVVRNENYLKTIGVTKRQMVPYSDACMQGWAPSPTNDVQKKIWDEVHQLPTNPIKIEFDEKRDKGK